METILTHVILPRSLLYTPSTGRGFLRGGDESHEGERNRDVIIMTVSVHNEKAPSR